MKKLIALTLFITTFSTIAQNNHLVEITLDGKPAILNTKTGETKYTNGSTSVSPSFSNNNVNEIDVINTHQVEKGDTLYSISKKYGVSMAQIKTVNNLTSNVLSINQSLKIGYAVSAEVDQSSTWKVAKGDTLYAISKKTDVSVSEIKRLNNLETNNIVIGQTLSLN